MRPSITRSNSPRRRIRLWAAAVWLLIWQLAAAALGQDLLLSSPVTVALRLAALLTEASFWQTVGFSFGRIVAGFALAIAAGTLLAVLSARFVPVRELLEPAIGIIKSTPVASFIILVLIWIPSRNLSVLISFLMVLPIIYANLLEAIGSIDVRLIEMADVFEVKAAARVRYIYLSQMMPYFRSACSVALGLCWKSGVAAEVIGIPGGSIGERLYHAKVYLNMPDLFAWTVVIIVVSLLFERLFLAGVDRLVSRLERM